MERKKIEKATVAYDIPASVKNRYDHLGGFTIAESNFAFAARNSSDNGRLYTKPISGGTLKNGSQVNMKHGNDLAYYNGSYYLAMGNISEHNKVKSIYQFTSNLEPSRMFDFVDLKENPDNGLGPLAYISKICHYEGDKFIVGNGLSLSLCKLDLAGARFIELGRFELKGDGDLKRTGCTRAGQGMYYTGGHIFAVFSYKNGQYYTKNDIAIYYITSKGGTLDATLVKIVEFDSEAASISELNLFELEGIASANSTFYVDTNQRKDGTSYDCIYDIGYIW